MFPAMCAVLTLSVLGASAARAQGEAMKIGVFDPEVLWKQTDIGKKYNEDLSVARDRLLAQIDKKTEELQTTRSKLRQQQQTLSVDKVTEMQQYILSKETELDRLNEDATKEMKFQFGQFQGRFQEMLTKTLDAFGKEKGYALILTRGAVVYSASSIDIDQYLIAKFNEMNKPPASTTATPPRKPEAGKEPPKN
jgi:Skp family chaperone for outer membrane proteins